MLLGVLQGVRDRLGKEIYANCKAKDEKIILPITRERIERFGENKMHKG